MTSSPRGRLGLKHGVDNDFGLVWLALHFHFAQGFDTPTRYDSMILISKRVADDHCANIPTYARPAVCTRVLRAGKEHSGQTDAGLSPPECAAVSDG